MIKKIKQKMANRLPVVTAVAVFVTVALVYGGFLFISPQVKAADFNYVVNSTNDVSDGTCDGVHCSYREAITAANADGGTSEITFSASGTIAFTAAQAQISQPVSIIGPGAGSLTLDCNGNGTYAIRFNSTNAAGSSVTGGMTIQNCSTAVQLVRSNVTISDLTIINGNITNVSSAVDGVTISNNILSGAAGYLSLSASSSAVTNSTISGNSFNGCTATAMTLGLSDNNTVDDNTITNCASGGNVTLLYVTGDNVNITNNDISSSSTNNMLILHTSGNAVDNLEISGNVITNGSNGLFFVGQSGATNILTNILIDNNTVTGVTGGGISTDGYAAGSSVTVSNNNVTSSDSINISLDLSAGVETASVTGNTASGSSSSIGLYILSSGETVTITGNTANSNDSHGIVLDNVDSSTISSNTTNDNGEYGLSIDNATGLTISDNDADGNSVGLVLGTTTDGGGHDISLNTWSGAIGAGQANGGGFFYANIGAGTTLSDNIVSDNLRYGIWLYSGSNGVTVSGNTLTDNGVQDLGETRSSYFISDSGVHSFTDETITNAVAGSMVAGMIFFNAVGTPPSQTVSESTISISGGGYGVYVSTPGATISFDNVDFDNNYVVDEGTLDVNYDARVYATANALPVENVDVTATANGGGDTALGLTAGTGYTAYTSLDAYQVTSGGLQNNKNPYTIVGTHVDYNDSNTSPTINERNQTVNLTMSTSIVIPPIYTCANGADDDGDGFTDMADPGCVGPTDDSENDSFLCNNDLDDDGDGLIDLLDPGCSGPGDNSENSDVIEETFACNDGIDNDQDGQTDYPQDSDCESSTDDSEEPEIIAVCGDSQVEGDEQCDDGNTSSGDGCSASCDYEICRADNLMGYWKFDNDNGRDYSSYGRTATLHNLTASSPCHAGGCYDFSSASSSYASVSAGSSLALSQFTIDAWFASSAGSGWQAIIARGEDSSSGQMNYALYVDKADNKLVCWFDGQDGQEYRLKTSFSSSSLSHAACTFDGSNFKIYLNGNLKTGTLYRETTVITDLAGASPATPSDAPLTIGAYTSSTSDNGIPGNEVLSGFFNGQIDEVTIYSTALSAAAISAIHQGSFCALGDYVLSACSDEIDNDGDGAIDLADYSCQNDPTRNTELSPYAACQNGRDDDDDGLTDLDDPGCENSQDNDEINEEIIEPTLCNNTLDDDADGLIDLEDPGCENAEDNDETDEIIKELPACSNQTDDDADGLIDLADPGCENAEDNSEIDQEILPQIAACANNIDDDADGLIDLADPGCADINDSDETDEELLPEEIIEETEVTIAEQIIENEIIASLGEIISNLSSGEIVQTLIKNVFDNTEVEQTARTIATPAVLALALVNTVAILPTLGFIPYLGFIFTEPLRFWFFRRRKYGVVYDSLLKRPVDLAIVRLYDAQTNKLVGTKVTDGRGRYSFVADPGQYYIKAQKTNYIFPSSVLGAQVRDHDFADLYYGAPITVTDQDSVIALNIPLDTNAPIEPDKTVIRRHRLKRLQKSLAYLGPILSVVAFIIAPGWLMGLVVALHMTLFVLFRRLARTYRPKSFGVVVDADDKKALGQTVVRLFDTEFNKLLATQVANGQGRYSFIVGPNNYYLRASKPNYREYKSEVLNYADQKEVIIDKDLSLDKGMSDKQSTTPHISTSEVVSPEPSPTVGQKITPNQPVVNHDIGETLAQYGISDEKSLDNKL